jgi:hypothetical protein
MGVQGSLSYIDLVSLGCIIKSGIVASYSNVHFSFLRTFHTDFYGGCTKLSVVLHASNPSTWEAEARGS